MPCPCLSQKFLKVHRRKQTSRLEKEFELVPKDDQAPTPIMHIQRLVRSCSFDPKRFDFLVAEPVT